MMTGRVVSALKREENGLGVVNPQLATVLLTPGTRSVAVKEAG